MADDAAQDDGESSREDSHDDSTPGDSTIEDTLRLFEDGVTPATRERLASLHQADQADVLSQLDPEVRAQLLPGMRTQALADVIAYLEQEARIEIIRELPQETLAPLLDLCDFDIAVDILHELPAELARETLSSMATKADVAPLLPYGDDTAGGRMTSGFVMLHQDWTVDRALDYLRTTSPGAEQVFYLYVTDDEHRLEGVVSLRELVVARPETAISALMTPDVVSVRASLDQEEVLRQIERYNFIALPVVDEDRRLEGIITVDDLLDVAEEEATEDMFLLAGLGEDESLLGPIGRSLLPRLVWLLVAMASGFGAAAVVNAFDNTLDRVLVLVVFMPVIASLGGNAGVQTVTLVVRSLALGKLEFRDIKRVLRRELVIGIVNGVIIGLILGVLVYLWKGNVALSIVAGVALLLNMAMGVTAGVLVPVSLRALRMDPALASGAVLTTFTDVLGFFFFLGLATLLIDQIA